MTQTSLFNSFFMGGFECSSHVLSSGRRLDMLAATLHDRYVLHDYERLRAHDIHTARTGLRWHLIERRTGTYDWSSVLPMIQASRTTGMQLIWDLLHYGYPEDLDIFSVAFVTRFERLAHAFARLLRQETDAVPFISPVNEISFFAWAGGDEAILNPYASGRSFELKLQLVRAAIAAIEAFWSVSPQTRIVHTDPVVHILPDPTLMHLAAEAEGYRTAQYQGWDLLSGRLRPEIGGDPRYLDILGLNFYSNNEWYYKGDTILRSDPNYKPFRCIAADVYERYGRPLFVAETGAEGDRRVDWFTYMCDEVYSAIEAGIPLHGLCLYPIVSFPGWEDERYCQNGLWDYADRTGERPIHTPFSDALREQQQRFAALDHRRPFQDS
ncbi:MAG: beta-glucosidase [Anaerolineae bacterium]